MAARRASLAIVLATTAVALAATMGGPLIATPNVGVAELAVGSPGTAAVTLSNTSTSTQSAAGVLPDTADCDDATMTAAPQSFAIASGSMQAMSVACNAAGSATMRRCLYHVQDSTGSDLATFLGVCESSLAAAFSPSSGSVSLTAAVGSSATTSVQLTNIGANASSVGTLHFQLDDLGGNFLLGTPCNPNVNGCDLPNSALGTVDVDVICVPSAATTFTGKLYVVDSLGDRLTSPVALSCTGTAATGPSIHVSTTPSPLDLRNVAVIGGSGSGNVHIVNVGTGTLNVTAVVINGAGNDWSFTLGTACTSLPCSLAPAAALDIAVRFTPTVLGRRDASMTIVSNDAANGETVVRLAGVGLGATLALAPGQTSMIDLGDVAKNGSTSLPIELVNGGDETLNGAMLSLAGSSQFSISPPVAVNVPAGATPTPVTLTCAPGGTTGALTTTFTVMGSNVIGSAIATVNATCHGTDSSLVASPSSLVLGELNTGVAAGPFTVTLKNTNSSALTVTGTPTVSPATSAVTVTGPSPLTIPAMGSANIMVTVDTSADTTIATSILASDSSGDSISIPVSGNVATASVAVPQTVSVGTFCVNQPTTPTTIALTATGSATIELPSAPGMSLASSPFSVAAKTPLVFPADVIPGASALVEVTPNRQRMAMTVTDTLQWTTDLVATPLLTTAVTATFLANGAALAPAAIAFGDQPPHLFVDDSQPVLIQNCSGATIELSPSIDPPFSIDANFPSSLTSGATATFGVSFHPTRAGAFSGALTINTTPASATPLTIALTGAGLTTTPYLDAGSSAGTPTESTSFYACSCATDDPRGGWPIALAFAIALWPRRGVTARRRRGSSSAR